MLATLHLVRHGEVHNPAGIVYADLPGFPLSPTGRAQADAAAERLASTPVTVLVCSPLERAQATAATISAAVVADLQTDDRLTEWAIAVRWAGVAWTDLPSRFPGEMEAYALHPADLPFVSETIDQVAARMARVVDEVGERHPGGTAVLVSHQDPLQALRLRLTGRDIGQLHEDKPVHAGVITLSSSGSQWEETARWAPPATSPPFPPITE